jgi:hypothetical protein
MYFMKKIWPVLLCTGLLCIGCTDEENPAATPVPADPVAGLTKISEGYAVGAGIKVQLWSKTSLMTGYNSVRIALIDSAKGSYITDAQVQVMPMMDMGTMKHSAPVENPSGDKAVNSLFQCQMIFIMSSMGGTWTADVTVLNKGTGASGKASLAFAVADPAVPCMRSITAKNDSAKLFVSFLQPSAPKLGVNDCEITIHRKASMMSFPADSGYTVVVTPEMPSMGHGSPNNVNPTHVGNGHYQGKVNFTMTGDWRINLDIYKNGAVVDTTMYFDITL